MSALGGSIKSDWSTAGVVITLRMKADSGAVYERPNAGRAEGSKSLFLPVRVGVSRIRRLSLICRYSIRNTNNAILWRNSPTAIPYTATDCEPLPVKSSPLPCAPRLCRAPPSAWYRAQKASLAVQ